MTKVKDKTKRNNIIKAAITAIIFTVFCYYVTNLGFSISGESALVTKINKRIKEWKQIKTDVPDSVLLVNISYDKELITLNDSNGLLKGEIDITNRESLFKFLDILDQRKDYKYVFLDVFFEEGYDSPSDSALFNKISSMPRVVIPRHRDAKLAAKDLLMPKAYISDYTITNTNEGFGKYELIAEGDTSVALHMYKELTGHDIKKRFIFYFDNGKLCNSTLFSRQSINFDSPYNDNADGVNNYYNLNADLLLLHDSIELANSKLLKDKYIIIGAMEMTDIHATAEGKIPGAVITANAFIGTMNGQHIVPVVMIFVFLLILFIVSYQVFSGKTIAKWIKKKLETKNIIINPTIFAYLCSWVSYVSILSIAGVISYIIYGVIYDILFTATLFQVADYIITNWKDLSHPNWNMIKDLFINATFSKVK